MLKKFFQNLFSIDESAGIPQKSPAYLDALTQNYRSQLETKYPDYDFMPLIIPELGKNYTLKIRKIEWSTFVGERIHEGQAFAQFDMGGSILELGAPFNGYLSYVHDQEAGYLPGDLYAVICKQEFVLLNLHGIQKLT
ncbi:MAG: hypothetical protein AAFR59_02875 [Bacteroidota bacterium]